MSPEMCCATIRDSGGVESAMDVAAGGCSRSQIHRPGWMPKNAPKTQLESGLVSWVGLVVFVRLLCCAVLMLMLCGSWCFTLPHTLSTAETDRFSVVSWKVADEDEASRRTDSALRARLAWLIVFD
jgi:hypothetical protein